MGWVVGWDYELVSGLPVDPLRTAAWSLLQADQLLLPRKSKSGPLTIDGRPMLRHLRVRDDGVVELGLGMAEGRPGKARDWLGLLQLPPTTRVVRTEVYVEEAAVLRSPGEGWSVTTG